MLRQASELSTPAVHGGLQPADRISWWSWDAESVRHRCRRAGSVPRIGEANQALADGFRPTVRRQRACPPPPTATPRPFDCPAFGCAADPGFAGMPPAELVREPHRGMQAAHTPRFTFEGSGLGSGISFRCLVAGGTDLTRKMVLVL